MEKIHVYQELYKITQKQNTYYSVNKWTPRWTRFTDMNLCQNVLSDIARHLLKLFFMAFYLTNHLLKLFPGFGLSLRLGLDSLPHPDIPKTGPSVGPSVCQHSNAETAELLRHFRFDFAVSHFPVVAPRPIWQIFAENCPSGVVVANGVVGTNKLVGRRRSLSGATLLSRLEGQLCWSDALGFEVIPNHDWWTLSRCFARSDMPTIINGQLSFKSIFRPPVVAVVTGSTCHTSRESYLFDAIYWEWYLCPGDSEEKNKSQETDLEHDCDAHGVVYFSRI